MRIGLLSDSHGRAATTRTAVRLLLEEGVELLLHLGDINAEEVIDAMIEDVDDAGNPRPPVRIVFGNTDWDARSLARYAEGLGVIVDDPVGRIEVDGKTLVYTHGHLPSAMREAVGEGVDYLCHGHTHRRHDERVGPTRVINPGALFRAAEHTAAVLDVASDHLTFVPVPSDR